MANRDAPIGFIPATGVGAPHQYREFPVDTSNTTGIYIGDVCDFDGTAVVPAAADAGVSAVGVAVAVSDSNHIPCGHPNSSQSTKYLPASVAGFVNVALALPGCIFRCQSSSGGNVAATDIGATADHVAGTGDTTTARSRHELNHATGGLQFRILGKVEQPGNGWDDANVELYVMFNESALGTSGEASV